MKGFIRVYSCHIHILIRVIRVTLNFLLHKEHECVDPYYFFPYSCIFQEPVLRTTMVERSQRIAFFINFLKF